MTTSDTIASRIAAFTGTLDWRDLPPDVVEKAKTTLLHNLAVALAGHALADQSRAYARLHEASPKSTARLLVSGEPTDAEGAAFANAGLIHARAQDDVYFPGLTHLGATVLPAVLAVGEQLGSSGKELITAMVAGYEAAAVLGQFAAASATRRGFRATGLFGVVGAAAGVARLLELDTDRTTAALAISSCLAGGTNQAWVAGSQEWQFEVGFAARGGITAATLASLGGTGAPSAFEGKAGLLGAVSDELTGPELIGTDLGSVWRIRNVTYKPYPVCAILQEPVQAAIELHHQGNLALADIAKVRLTLSPGEAAYPGTDWVGPFSGVGGTLMSGQFCIVVALSQGYVRASDLLRFSDQDLLAVVRRAEIVADPSLDAREFRLAVETKAGSFTAESNPKGEAFNWDRAEVANQVYSMVDEFPPGYGSADGLIDAVNRLETLSVTSLINACVVGR